jgi:hypothetical protein
VRTILSNKGHQETVMATFEIEQYEIHVSTFLVEANSEAEAIVKFKKNGGDFVDNSTEYIEPYPHEDFGLSAEHLVKELENIGFRIHDIIPGIRSISCVEK